MPQIKLKYKLKYVKWMLLCFFLLGNLLLLAPNDDLLFIIIYEISINVLAIGSFVLLSFFPRLYYIFDEKGMSYQNRKGKEYIYIPWDKVEKMSYGYVFGIIPDGLEIILKNGAEIKNMNIAITFKQAQEIYNGIQAVRDVMDKPR